MGVELEYQAIPTGQMLIERTRTDIEFGESLCLLSFLLRHKVDESFGPMRDVAQRLLVEHPGLLKRYCDLGKRWDELHYLLSATRREEPPTDDDRAIDKAFRDGEVIADHVRGTLGHPIRYMTPADVVAVARVIGGMNEESLRAHYDPVRMEAEGVYKFWADRADDAEWKWLVEEFTRFRTFFQLVADRSEGVLVMWS